MHSVAISSSSSLAGEIKKRKRRKNNKKKNPESTTYTSETTRSSDGDTADKIKLIQSSMKRVVFGKTPLKQLESTTNPLPAEIWGLKSKLTYAAVVKSMRPKSTTYPAPTLIQIGELKSKPEAQVLPIPKTESSPEEIGELKSKSESTTYPSFIGETGKLKSELKPDTNSEDECHPGDKQPGEDIYDIADLLFSKRDYLVIRNSREVTLNDLAGKYLCIYFIPLSPLPLRKQHVDDTNNLKDVYFQLSKTNKDCFEVVFIPTDIDGSYSQPLSKAYRSLLTTMPWPAIPYKDFEARKHACDRLCASSCVYYSTVVLLDPTGYVLRNIGMTELLKTCGSEAFPFTPERLLEIDRLNRIARTGKASLETLLSSSVRDFVITNDQKEVRICELKLKTVGLLLYRENDGCNKLTDQLKLVYRKHKDHFQVVLIHLYFDLFGTVEPVNKVSFFKIFKSMPWLALPFKDPTCRTLWRIFQWYQTKAYYNLGRPMLIIVKPDGSFEKDGYCILERYGTEAYPFTWEKAAEIEVARMKKLKLDSLMKKPGYVLRGKDELKVCELLGKRVLLLFAKELSFGRNLLLWTFRFQYWKQRGTEYEFEVVYVSQCETVRYYHNSVADLPWLVLPYNRHVERKLVRQFFKCSGWPSKAGMGIVAFGQDGHILGKEIIENGNMEKYDTRHKAFPFVDKDLKFQARQDLRIVQLLSD